MSDTASPWAFRGRPREVIDGDTVEVQLDLGFRMRRVIRLRLAELDTAEMHFVAHDSEEFRRGIAHKEYVERWLNTAREESDGNWPLVIQTEKKGKYGRYVATVRRQSDGAELNSDLLSEFGDAVEY